MQHRSERMAAWLVLLVIALLCGLALDKTTLFWVGVLSLWVLSNGRSDA
jgi:hypothetical protein